MGGLADGNSGFAAERASSSEALGRNGHVSWGDAEEALGDAIEWLGALGDREGAFLAAGRRSAWPKVLRIEQSDYPDRPDPRIRLSRRQMVHVERMLLNTDALCLALPEQHRALVGRVLVMKRFPSAGGFRWGEVRKALQRQAKDGERVPAADALRMRYERAIGALARAMNLATGTTN